MDELYVILAAATYHQQHKADKAIEELKTYAKQHPASLAIRFAAIQLDLLSSQPAAALKTLEDYLDHVHDDVKATHRPAVVALQVWLYEQTGQAEKAMSVLDQASKYWKDNHQAGMPVSAKSSSSPSTESQQQQTTPSILKQTAAFKLKTGRYSDAAADYEQLVKADPTDTQAIAGLISAYAEVDPAKAEQYGDVLPPITANDTLNVDDLESVVPGVKKGYMKKDPSR
jgi:signal recognition particle subunit SRP72